MHALYLHRAEYLLTRCTGNSSDDCALLNKSLALLMPPDRPVSIVFFLCGLAIGSDFPFSVRVCSPPCACSRSERSFSSRIRFCSAVRRESSSSLSLAKFSNLARKFDGLAEPTI